MPTILGDAVGLGPSDAKPVKPTKEAAEVDGKDAHLREAFKALVASTSALERYNVAFGTRPAGSYKEGVCEACKQTTLVKKIPAYGYGPQDDPEDPPYYCEPCEMARLDRSNARQGKALEAFLVHKDNVGSVTACCMPGVVQNYMWRVALEETTWATSDAKFDFNRYNTHDMARDRANNEFSRVAGVVSQLKSKYDADMAKESKPAATVDIASKLKDLKAMKDAGELTASDFDVAKAQLLKA